MDFKKTGIASTITGKRASGEGPVYQHTYTKQNTTQVRTQISKTQMFIPSPPRSSTDNNYFKYCIQYELMVAGI